MSNKTMNQDQMVELLSEEYKRKYKKSPKGNTAIFKSIAKMFSKYKTQARNYLKNHRELEKFLLRVEKKLKEIPKIGDKLAYIPQMMLLIRSYAIGEYKDITKGEIVLILAALAYFVAPLDVFPDKIPGLGLADDALVAGLVVNYCEADIKAYMKWLEKKIEKEEKAKRKR